MFEGYIDKVQVVRLMEDYVPKDEKNEKAVGGKFFIPKYQRGYRWTSLQVEQLLDDINEFKAEDEDEFYCLQPLVVTAEKNEDRWVVVDGQQRLTTIFIIIKCLRSIADSQKKKPIYSIDYESKPELKECLSKLKHDPDEEEGIELDKSDIDKYHITNAYNTVAKWVKSKVSGAEEGDFASDLMTKIRNSVCFIWYEADNGQDPETTFTQINMGKIPLTNAELIKALLLKKDNFDRDEEFRGDQARISMDWDIKENNLHKRDFWLFLTNDKAEERDVRIEMVFDVMARDIIKTNGSEESFEVLREKNPNTYLFLIFTEEINKMIAAEKKRSEALNEPYRYGTVLNEFWMRVNSFYQMFQDWYEEKEWYHLVGYWIAAHELESKKIDVNELLYALSDVYQTKTKTEFTVRLKKQILKNLLGGKNGLDDATLEDLTYGTLKEEFSGLYYTGSTADVTKIKKILLLFNVITMQTNMEMDSKFPFHYYKTTVWNLEHIHAATTNVPLREVDKRSWRDAVYEFLGTVDYPLPDDLKKRLAEINDFKDNSEEFIQLYADVSKTFSSGELEEDVMRNGLPNLTLLDENTNKSYKNDIFPMKRNYIMDKMGKEVFIPICTKNVFLKYYTSGVKQYYVWDKDDRKWYFKKMCESLYEYLTGKVAVEDEVATIDTKEEA